MKRTAAYVERINYPLLRVFVLVLLGVEDGVDHDVGL